MYTPTATSQHFSNEKEYLFTEFDCNNYMQIEFIRRLGV